VFFQRSRQRTSLAGRAHTHTHQRRQQIRRNCQPRTLRDVVNVADDFYSLARANDTGQQFRQTLAGAFNAGRHNPCRDDGCLEQSEVILRKVKEIPEVGYFCRSTKVDTHQPKARLLDNPQVGLHRRPG
jgi:hypothetical protein